MDVDIEDRDSTAVLSLGGELDISTADKLEEAVRSARTNNPETVVLDLRGLTFMDSSGLRTLIETRKRLKEAGIRLMLVRGPEVVDKIFKITMTDIQFEFVEEPEA